MLGLDNAGKSTIVNHLKEYRMKPDEITPTVGFKREIIHWVPENCELTIYDMSGKQHLTSTKIDDHSDNDELIPFPKKKTLYQGKLGIAIYGRTIILYYQGSFLW